LFYFTFWVPDRIARFLCISVSYSSFIGIIAVFYCSSLPQMKSSNLNCRLGESKIMTMCLIYLLAGAFAVVSKAMGGVDAVVI
jgi:Na+/H+ antiporter NhaC